MSAPFRQSIRLWDTRTHSERDFVSLKKGMATVYSCGPTVYQRAHIGNFRAYVFADTLARLLKFSGYKLKHVINITDVGHLTDDADAGEDKLERESARKGKRAQAIAKEYTRQFFKDLRVLNVERGAIFPRASEHIREQIAIVRALEKKGLVYRTSDGMYFDTAKYPAYGALEPDRVTGQRAGARVELGEKKSPTDFALWKFSPKGGGKRQQEWKSPWGVGFPGWHLECSAMSMKYLGKQFDIHTGGVDHISVHHTNEIAQSEALTGKPLAQYWMHVAFLTLGKSEKMAKSEGNAMTLDDVAVGGCDALDMRYLYLQTHYRKQMQFSTDALIAARSARLALSERALSPDPRTNDDVVSALRDAIAHDANTAQALAVLWDAVKTKKLSRDVIRAANMLLGLNLGKKVAIPLAVKKLMTQREKARTAKDWSASDRIRNDLLGLGYRVDDGPSGTTVHRL